MDLDVSGHIGFTGSRGQILAAQSDALWRLFESLNLAEPRRTLHHGDCVGADARASYIADEKGWTVHAHPPTDPKYRAFLSADVLHPEAPYLDRNHDIVDSSMILVACPSGPEKMRSGTWATVRYARRQGKIVHIVWPDGRHEIEWR